MKGQALGVVRAIGLMSGTSLNVDVALLETDGERIAAFGPTGYRPYADAERALLRHALAQGASLSDRAAPPGALTEAEVPVFHQALARDLNRPHPSVLAVSPMSLSSMVVIQSPATLARAML
jgi:1,6-anhydro-N-acetylmuramate kinase